MFLRANLKPSSNPIRHRTILRSSVVFGSGTPTPGDNFIVRARLYFPGYGGYNDALAKPIVAETAPKPKAKIDYAPRPELVRPAAGAPLPAPQEAATAIAAANWPESPEQRRARLKADATAKQNDPLFVPTIKNDGFGVQTAALTPAEQQARFRAARKANTAGSPNTRAFLSEPPLEYRAPADSAAVGEIGEDELKKEKRLKREAQKKPGSKSWRDFVPWR